MFLITSHKQVSEVSLDLSGFWKNLIANKKAIFPNEEEAIAEHWMLEMVQTILTIETDNEASFNGEGNF